VSNSDVWQSRGQSGRIRLSTKNGLAAPKPHFEEQWLRYIPHTFMIKNAAFCIRGLFMCFYKVFSGKAVCPRKLYRILSPWKYQDIYLCVSYDYHIRQLFFSKHNRILNIFNGNKVCFLRYELNSKYHVDEFKLHSRSKSALVFSLYISSPSDVRITRKPTILSQECEFVRTMLKVPWRC
jgi:hypothetical protein